MLGVVAASHQTRHASRARYVHSVPEPLRQTFLRQILVGQNPSSSEELMMFTLRSRFLAAFAAGVMVVQAASTHAAMMNYGTFVGDTVTFVDVTENNLDTNLHYKSFRVADDTLLFDPTGFAVQVSPGPGTRFIDSELETMIAAHPGYGLTSISFAEEGDYTIAGAAAVTVGVPLFWDIMEVDGSMITPISGSGQVDFMATETGTGRIWRVEFGLDLAVELATAEETRGEIGTHVTKVNIRFDNSLSANAHDNQSLAFIKKKQVEGVRVHTDVVPEPSSIVMLALGLCSLLWRRSF